MNEYSLEWSFGFGLSRRPFSMAPAPDRSVSIPRVKFAREALLRCISRNEGMGVLLGEAGVGKTLMCQTLYSQLMHRESVVDLNQILLLQRGVVHSGVELDAAILSAAGVEIPHRSMVRSTLEQFLTSLEYGLLVIVDTADFFSVSAWSEIQNLANFCHEGRVPIQWILSGSTILEERLAEPRFVSLNQRIAVRIALQAFDMSETQEYVDSQIRAAKGEPRQFFSEQGCRKIYHLTDGIPRLINLLGDRVLWNGLQNGVEGPFSESDIVEAWEEIEGMASPKGVTPQQPPVTAENRIESPSVAAEHVALNEDATVSFGELDDDEPTIDASEAAKPETHGWNTEQLNEWQSESRREVQLESLHLKSVPSSDYFPTSLEAKWTEPQGVRISAQSVNLERGVPTSHSASDGIDNATPRENDSPKSSQASDWYQPAHTVSSSESEKPRTTMLFSCLRRRQRHPF